MKLLFQFCHTLAVSGLTGYVVSVNHFKKLACACVHACRKTALEIHFMYLGNKDIFSIFKTCCIASAVFSTKCHYFIIFSLSVKIIPYLSECKTTLIQPPKQNTPAKGKCIYPNLRRPLINKTFAQKNVLLLTALT
jgi:hypothetical protein